MKAVIILGSSRSDGNTYKLVKKLTEITGWNTIDLNDYKIAHFDYQYKNKNDDYLTLMEHIIDDYDIFILATPVYWYAMSGVMKVFMDRLTDLLTIRKDLGRRLKNKSIAVITSSVGNNLGDHFWLPFSKTAEYLDMNFLGTLHTNSEELNEKLIKKFVKKVKKKGLNNL